MKAILFCSKKTVLLALVVVAIGMSSAIRAQCSSCQAVMVGLAAVVEKMSKNLELDTDFVGEDSSRAARQELTDPCDNSTIPADISNACENDTLAALAECCAHVNLQVMQQRREAKKCCKKTKHELNEIETILGDPVRGSAIDIPSCNEVSSIVDVINSTDIDVISWLKSLYILLFRVYQCTCHPCIEL